MGLLKNLSGVVPRIFKKKEKVTKVPCVVVGERKLSTHERSYYDEVSFRMKQWKIMSEIWLIDDVQTYKDKAQGIVDCYEVINNSLRLNVTFSDDEIETLSMVNNIGIARFNLVLNPNDVKCKQALVKAVKLYNDKKEFITYINDIMLNRVH